MILTVCSSFKLIPVIIAASFAWLGQTLETFYFSALNVLGVTGKVYIRTEKRLLVLCLFCPCLYLRKVCRRLSAFRAPPVAVLFYL